MRNLYLSMLFAFSFLKIEAQYSIQINTTVNPPYSPYLSSYESQPNKLMASITNQSRLPAQLKFGITLTGDNGVKIYSDIHFKPGTPFVLNPLQTKVLTSQNTELKDYFSANNLSFVGITKNQLVQNEALPEGNYELCIRAYDYNTGQPLSDESPLGCAQLPLHYIDPPMLIQPICGNEVIALNPQNIIFTWAPPATAPIGLQYEFTLKEIPTSSDKILQSKSNALNPNDVIKNPAFPILYSTTQTNSTLIYNPSLPRLYEGKKYVWRVQAKSQGNKVVFKQNGYTEACVFEYKTAKPIANKSKIVLRSPANKSEQIWKETDKNNAYYEFSWYPLETGKYAYETQIVKIENGQTPEEAMQKNKLAIEDEKGAKYKPPYLLNRILKPGNYAWKVVYMDLEDPNNRVESDVWSFNIPQPDTGSFKKFMTCNNEIFISKITNPDLENFSGEGYYFYKKTFGEQGVKQKVYFSNLKLKHTEIDANGQKTNWKCYAGEVQGDIQNVKTELEPQQGLEGYFEYIPQYIRIHAALNPQYDANKKIYIVEEGDKGEGCKVNITGELEWTSNLVITQGSKIGETPIPIPTDFSNFALFKTKFKVENTTAKFKKDYTLFLISPDNTKLIFNKESYFNFVGNKIYANFQGDVYVNSGKYLNLYGTKFPITLDYSFTYATGMLFKLTSKPSNFKEFRWDKNGNIYTDLSVTEAWLKLGDDAPYNVNCSGKGLVIVPYINFKNAGPKEFKIGLPYMINKGKGFNINKTQPFEGLSLYKFKANTKTCKVRIKDSKLVEFNLVGDIEVPFINQKAPFSIYGNYDEKPVANVNFDFKTSSTVLDNGVQKVTVLPSYAKLINEEEILFEGLFTFKNSDAKFQDVNSNDQKFEAPFAYMDGIIIKADNTVKVKNGKRNFSWQSSASYNDFDYKLTQYSIATNQGKHTISFWGDLVMEEETLVPQDKLKMDFSYNAYPYPFPNIDPSLTASAASAVPAEYTDVQITSNSIKVEYCNSSLCFDALFKYLNDQVYGKGFLAEGNADLKEPCQGKIHAKFMCGKAPSKYKYWFVEASQKELIEFSTGILDLGVYGFGGRLYYHMYHNPGEKNIDKSDYVPNESVGFGVYGLLNLKTLGSNGKVLWGTTSVEVATLSSGGLMPIKIRGEAFILSDGVEDVNASIHGTADLTLNVMNPRYLIGIVNVDANYRDFVQANGTLSFQMGDGKWYMHLGTSNSPVSAYIPPLDKQLTGYITIDKIFGNIVLGAGCGGELFGFHSHKKKCIGLYPFECCFSAGADVSLSGNVGAQATFPSFQLSGNVQLSASASVSASACGIGMSPGISATFNGAFSLPNPFCIAGGLTLVTPSPLPNFTIKVRYKDGVISGKNTCD